ncbi:putative DNA binding domain-containing protein [Rhodospirillales bacterium]|nr:putative DNA binding domain-containing protein [Rhodospirillales bacterium]
MSWLRKAADQDHPEAQCRLGNCYLGGYGVDEDDAEAVSWYRKAADQDDAEAQWRLGNCYLGGHGVEEDEAEAVSWYRKAADKNHAVAQWRLGNCYLVGLGVEEDDDEAVSWYRKAADQDNAEAQERLGNCYLHGWGVEKDETEAVSWYKKAADQDNAEAQERLGNCYLSGWGVEEDEAEAASWLKKAADQDNAEALNMLGACYHHGHGVEPDIEKAKMYIQKSLDAGYEEDEDDKYERALIGQAKTKEDTLTSANVIPLFPGKAVSDFRSEALNQDSEIKPAPKEDTKQQTGTRKKEDLSTPALQIMVPGHNLRQKFDARHIQTHDLLKEPEGLTLEFKSSARWDYLQEKETKVPIHAVIRTVGGFMNGRGGTLLIGIDDNGKILGVEKDIELSAPKQNADGYMLWLTSVIGNTLGGEFPKSLIADIQFEEFEGKSICRIDVDECLLDKGIYANSNKLGLENDTFFLRQGNSTQPLTPKATADYLEQRRRRRTLKS